MTQITEEHKFHCEMFEHESSKAVVWSGDVIGKDHEDHEDIARKFVAQKENREAEYPVAAGIKDAFVLVKGKGITKKIRVFGIPCYDSEETQ